MVSGSRIRQIGWAVVLGTCLAVLLALTFKVNAVKSDVRLTERAIIAAQQERLMLETEFQTRASQHQLSDWNAVEFGYGAPRADQYLESETQLAVLGSPRGIDAPSPVRVALNRPEREDEDGEGVLTGWIAASQPVLVASEGGARRELSATGLAQRLSNPVAPIAQVAEVSQ